MPDPLVDRREAHGSASVPGVSVVRRPMPQRVVPMLAVASGLPADDAGWAYEIKWDGVRAVAFVEGGNVRLQSRNLLDVTQQYPEVRGMGHAVAGRSAVLDGEVVALDERGVPSFSRLQNRMGVTSESDARSRARVQPVVYVAFDCLHLDGVDLMRRPYVERRERLDALALDGPHWQTPPYIEGSGLGMLEASRERGLEGVVAKRTASAYEPGRRSPAWRKIKNQRRQEAVVCGWSPGEGRRSGGIGALVLGVYDATPAEAAERGRPARLVYVGKVGTGYTDAVLDALATRLRPLARATSPFDEGAPPRGVTFVEPRLVAEVEFTEWTHGGTLRHPSFKGLREDKDAREVVREEERYRA